MKLPPKLKGYQIKRLAGYGARSRRNRVFRYELLLSQVIEFLGDAGFAWRPRLPVNFFDTVIYFQQGA
jgi:hypothetical protein